MKKKYRQLRSESREEDGRGGGGGGGGGSGGGGGGEGLHATGGVDEVKDPNVNTESSSSISKGQEQQQQTQTKVMKVQQEEGDQQYYERMRKSPTDPFRPIKLKMIPRNIQLGRGAPLTTSANNGAGGFGHSSLSVGSSVPSRAVPHTAVVHSGGTHTLLRNSSPLPHHQQPPIPHHQQVHQQPPLPHHQQPPIPHHQQVHQQPPLPHQPLPHHQPPLTHQPASVMRCGRRCSSPQPPLLAGCVPFPPCTSTPRSAQTSPLNTPRSPRLTSSTSDPWSVIMPKNYRAHSVGGVIPPGEMDWLPAPSPCSRKSSWSSASTDNDYSPCW
ncbi:hypothetical protein Pcinc_035550 [Petrolisthes cinctipes]|uniref:Uncharacterized protein n=1 Tax=Petrolisthes cinctipes TaxID=88211 RepID=A0AAE1EN73_PETCI|nr:hypothetical protein Pcinc_035550 [Petrolisthes cinctipes]